MVTMVGFSILKCSVWSIISTQQSYIKKKEGTAAAGFVVKRKSELLFQANKSHEGAFGVKEEGGSTTKNLRKSTKTSGSGTKMGPY
jgi:hypothetical protein